MLLILKNNYNFKWIEQNRSQLRDEDGEKPEVLLISSAPSRKNGLAWKLILTHTYTGLKYDNVAEEVSTLLEFYERITWDVTPSMSTAPWTYFFFRFVKSRKFLFYPDQPWLA